MACVYILYSAEIDEYYIGSCLDFESRVIDHLQNKRNSFTSRANDWMAYYKIEDLEYEQSRLIEKHIKKMKSRVYVQNLKKYPEICIKLLKLYKRQ
jgi:putative endonuclease